MCRYHPAGYQTLVFAGKGGQMFKHWIYGIGIAVLLAGTGAVSTPQLPDILPPEEDEVPRTVTVTELRISRNFLRAPIRRMRRVF